eukprot:TRINITY_DN6895_c0_g1_i1.p2 TRINITY_DN6895_c0_g1~~TRINITY_DN6895_c0_g1_i1.p2  ORF type:complete len:142 (+),score=23.29 TRINITY_DN6895_c0_g1_i1:44-469(+)
MQRAAAVPDVDVSRWVIVYPVYINARKTLQEGRKMPKIHCVDNPTCLEVQEVCLKLGLESYIETEKCYSRDPTMRGRVRVHLKDSKTENAVNPEVTSRTALLKKIGQDISKNRAVAVSAPATTTTTTAEAGPRRKGKARNK